MSTSFGAFEVSPNCSDPYFKWGLEKVRDNDDTLLADPQTIAIVFKDADGNVVADVDAADARRNTTAVTIANETFPISTAVLFTVTVGAVTPATFSLDRWPANLVAEMSYETTGGLVETTVKDVLLRPVEAR